MRAGPGFLVTGAVLMVALAGCGSDIPAGALTEDDLPDGVSVSKVTHDVQANQVQCQDVNDAEDDHVLYVSPSIDEDKRVAVSFAIEGSDHEHLGSSVWRLPDPEAALEQVSKGLDKCVKHYPENYRRIEIDGHPEAVAYTAQGEFSTPEFTRRILVPAKDRVVIVSITKSGDDKFSVLPDELLAKAIKASAAAPK
jgi:hypothetical protein